MNKNLKKSLKVEIQSPLVTVYLGMTGWGVGPPTMQSYIHFVVYTEKKER